MPNINNESQRTEPSLFDDNPDLLGIPTEAPTNIDEIAGAISRISEGRYPYAVHEQRRADLVDLRGEDKAGEQTGIKPRPRLEAVEDGTTRVSGQLRPVLMPKKVIETPGRDRSNWPSDTDVLLEARDRRNSQSKHERDVERRKLDVGLAIARRGLSSRTRTRKLY